MKARAPSIAEQSDGPNPRLTYCFPCTVTLAFTQPIAKNAYSTIMIDNKFARSAGESHTGKTTNAAPPKKLAFSQKCRKAHALGMRAFVDDLLANSIVARRNVNSRIAGSVSAIWAVMRTGVRRRPLLIASAFRGVASAVLFLLPAVRRPLSRNAAIPHPSSGTTVTCSGSSSTPVVAVAGSTGVTINVFPVPQSAAPTYCRSLPHSQCRPKQHYHQ